MNRSVKKIKETITLFKESLLSFPFFRLLRKINKTHVAGFFVFLFFIGIFASFIPQDLYAANLQMEKTVGSNISSEGSGFSLWEWFKGTTHSATASLISFLGIKFLDLLSLLLIQTGNLFDFTVDLTITNLTTTLEGFEDGIDDAWKVLRDLANMLFIFVLLYISIATILQLGGMQTKRLLKNVIIIALLINFSMFFTHIIIDVSNSVAVAFHNAAKEVAIEGAQAANAYDTGNPPNISHAFLSSSAITSVYKEDDGNHLKKLAEGEISGILGLVAIGGIFIMTLSFVLCAGALFLIARLVMFIILIILSPLAFIAAILPQTSNLFQKWSKSLTNNALFAPIFMALLFASLKVLEAAETSNIINTGNSGIADVAQGTINPVTRTAELNPDSAAVIFQTILVVGMLFASLMIAKNLSIHGANRATAIGSKWGKAALGASTAGLAARGARRTIGAGAARAKDSKKMKEWSSSSNPFTAKMATMGLGAADKTAKSSFDVRATGVAGDNLGKSGGKGGYDAIRQKKIDKEKERKERLNTSPKYKEQVKTELDEAKKSGDRTQRKEAQMKHDQELGVSEAEAKKRRDKADRAAKRVAQAEQNRRSNQGRALLNRQEYNQKVEQHRKMIETKMREAGMSLKKTDSRAERLQKDYIKNRKDGIISNKAYLREALKKDGSNKKDSTDK